MNNAMIVGLIAGLVGGAAAGVGTGLLADSEKSAPAHVEDVGLFPGMTEEVDLSVELADLRRENKELSLRLSTLESRSANQSREAVPVAQTANFEELQAQLAELAAALKNPQSAQATGLRNMVATTMEEVKEAEAEGRRVEREQREIDRIVERMDKYAETLGLDNIQKKSMQDVLLTANIQRTALWTSMRDGGGIAREDIRSTMKTMTDDTQAKLGNILTVQQLETYNAESNDRGGRFGGGGRGGRGGI